MTMFTALRTRKPRRALQAELAKQANGAVQFFGHALKLKTTNPAKGQEDDAIDLTIEENRDAIRDELVRIIHEYGLEGCNEAQIGGERLVTILMNQLKPSITDAAVCSALAINSINLIARTYYEDYPQYKPLRDMVDNLARICCSGAAQTIGAELPPEVLSTWPYFSRIFATAKSSDLLLWPILAGDVDCAPFRRHESRRFG